MQAAKLFEAGKSQADVARAVGVSREAVSQWYHHWSDGGRQALVGAGRAGRRPRLSDEQITELEKALLEGPQANGFPTDLWTLARVADVIESRFGVAYSQTQTWDILRRRLGWSRQRPARRALERDDEAIVTWIKNDWPRIKKAPGAGGPGSSSKTSPASRSSQR
jgi:transposase